MIRFQHLVGFVALTTMALLLLLVVQEMPVFGNPDNPVHNELRYYYSENTVEETGAINAVTAIITDFRAFDTLGEVTVLLTAIAALVAVLRT